VTRQLKIREEPIQLSNKLTPLRQTVPMLDRVLPQQMLRNRQMDQQQEEMQQPQTLQQLMVLKNQPPMALRLSQLPMVQLPQPQLQEAQMDNQLQRSLDQQPVIGKRSSRLIRTKHKHLKMVLRP